MARRGEIKLKKIEVLTNLQLTGEQGITMIPTIICDNDKLSGIYLSPKRIRSFIAKCRAGQDQQSSP